MSHDHALKDDVGFLKRLAAQGRGEPAPLAWLLALFGLIYGFNFLLTAGLIAVVRAEEMSVSEFNAIKLPISYAGHAIFVLALIAACIQMWLTRDRRPKVNAVAGAAWAAAFVGLIVSIACMVLLDTHGLRIFHFRNFLLTFGALPSIALVLYGIAWWVAGAATRRWWAFGVALASFVCAIAWAASIQTYAMMNIIPGVTLLALAFVPGLLLALSARRKNAASP